MTTNCRYRLWPLITVMCLHLLWPCSDAVLGAPTNPHPSGEPDYTNTASHLAPILGDFGLDDHVVEELLGHIVVLPSGQFATAARVDGELYSVVAYNAAILEPRIEQGMWQVTAAQARQFLAFPIVLQEISDGTAMLEPLATDMNLFVTMRGTGISFSRLESAQQRRAGSWLGTLVRIEDDAIANVSIAVPAASSSFVTYVLDRVARFIAMAFYDEALQKLDALAGLADVNWLVLSEGLLVRLRSLRMDANIGKEDYAEAGMMAELLLGDISELDSDFLKRLGPDGSHRLGQALYLAGLADVALHFVSIAATYFADHDPLESLLESIITSVSK